MREVSPYDEIKKAEFEYRNIGMAMEHNYLCAVCKHSSAVQDCATGILQPCWSCQKKYTMIRRKTFTDRLMEKIK